MSSRPGPGKGKKKKALMVSHVFPPLCSVGHSIRVVKFVKYLPALGWQPIVLTIDDQKEYYDYRKQGSESLLSDLSRDVSIIRTPAGEPSLKYLEKEKRFGELSSLTRAVVELLGGARRWAFRNFALPDSHIAWLPFALRRGRQIVKREGIDVIFATCPPHSATLIGAGLKRLSGRPLVLDFRDDWINTPWHNSRPRMIRMIERRLESWVVKTADKVVLVTERSRNAFLDRYPSQPREKFVFIPNGCDLVEFFVKDPTMRAESRDPRFTIMHAGSLNDARAWRRTPASLFQALHDISERQPELKKEMRLVFTGFLPEGQKLLANKMGLAGVVEELGFLPRDEYLGSMRDADLLLTINYDGFSTLIPGKIYEYWAIGGPPILLLSCPGAATSFVEEHGLGMAVEPANVAGIRDAILTVYRQRQLGAPLRIDRKGIEAYDRRYLSKKLADVFNGVGVPKNA